MTAGLVLGFDLRFEDLYHCEGLARLDRRFVDFLAMRNPDLHVRLLAARAAPDATADKAESDLIVELAPELEDFLGELFGIAAELDALAARHRTLDPLYSVKRLFVQRRAAKKHGPEQAAVFDGPALAAALEPLIGGELTELRFAKAVERWMKDEAPRTPRRSISPPAMPPGPCTPRKAASSTGTACCSRCRTRSTRSISLRS